MRLDSAAPDETGPVRAFHCRRIRRCEDVADLIVGADGAKEYGSGPLVETRGEGVAVNSATDSAKVLRPADSGKGALDTFDRPWHVGWDR